MDPSLPKPLAVLANLSFAFKARARSAVRILSKVLRRNLLGILEFQLTFQPFIVLQQKHHLFRFLTHMNALILALLHVLKVFECLDRENVFLALLRDLFGARFYEVLEKQQRFVDVTPIATVVVCSLPNHLHNFGKSDDVVGQIGNFRHEG